MKKKHLFCTKIWFYLTEIPLGFALYVATLYNFSFGDPWRHVPLMVILCATLTFIGIYFFRFITLSFEEVRYHGLFSSHDSAMINKDKTLIITMKPRCRLGVHLWGNDGRPPLYDALRGEGSIDIYLFRGKAVGGRRTVRSILKYYEIPEADIESVLTEEKFEVSTNDVELTAEHIEDIREIRLKFKRTV
ncbi:MAG: hypothetical protein J6Q69_01940 [Clostridia bacterium]|nr:hypothetical protein [Clostridia bacterium]